MCDPISLSVVAATASATAGVVGAVSEHQQSKYEYGVAKYNVSEKKNEAIKTRNKGVQEENRHRERVASFLASQKAQGAATGGDINSGSLLRLQDDTIVSGEEDALTIRQNFTDEADVIDKQADLDLSNARAKRKGADVKFATSILSTFGSFASSFAGGGVESPVAGKWASQGSPAYESRFSNVS